MLTLKVLSVLLSYPRAEMLSALDEMAGVIEREKLLPRKSQESVLRFIDSLRDAELMDLQERYVALFDRGRALSLHLFEHVHGESRDRGQAMVDLLNLYQTNGFTIAARELPDYVPLFLEYLSQQPRAEFRQLLSDAMPILSLLGARLAERESPFQVIFAALEGLAGEPDDVAGIRARVATEGPDETLVRMDEIWEEEAVSFMPDAGNCNNQTPTVSPVQVTRRRLSPNSSDGVTR